MTDQRAELGAIGIDGRSDGELAAAAAAGDREAASALIQRYHQPVRRFLRRLTGREDLADDLAQDTFVRMLRYADRYDPKYPMRTWLLVIARRLSIRHGQRQRRVMVVDQWDRADEKATGPAENVSRRDSNEVLRGKLDAAIAELTDAQRQAVVLFYQQGMSVQEAAEVMEVPVGTVKSHLHRARASMRKILGKDPEVIGT